MNSKWASVARSQLHKDNPITQHRSIIKAFGGDRNLTAFFEQLLYWSDKTNDPEGWIHKTYAEWHEEVFYSPYQIRKMTQDLIKRKLIKTERRSLGTNACPIHYRLIPEACQAFIEAALNGEVVHPEQAQDLNEQCEETSSCSTDEGQGEETTRCNNYNLQKVDVAPGTTSKNFTMQREETSSCSSEHNLISKRTTKRTPPISPPPDQEAKDLCSTSTTGNYSPGFELFWHTWPSHKRKRSRADAFKAWKKIKPSPDKNPDFLEAILQALERQKRGQAWMERGGEFIPMPATWLNGRRWEDEVIPYTAIEPHARGSGFQVEMNGQTIPVSRRTAGNMQAAASAAMSILEGAKGGQ